MTFSFTTMLDGRWKIPRWGSLVVNDGLYNLHGDDGDLLVVKSVDDEARLIPDDDQLVWCFYDDDEMLNTLSSPD